MATLVVTQRQAEPVRRAWHAWHANAHPDVDAPDGETFEQLRAALRNRDLPAVRRALAELAAPEWDAEKPRRRT